MSVPARQGTGVRVFDVIYLSFGVAAWAIVGYKSRAWFRDRSNADLGLACLMTGGVATVFLFSAPSLYRAFDRLAGVANLAMVFLYSSVVVFAAGALVLLLRWTAGEGAAARARARTRARAAVGAVAALWAVAITGFVVGRPDAVEHPRDFSTAYTDSPGVMLFLVLYLAIFGMSSAALGTLCPRLAARLGTTYLARGLRLLAAGCWLGLGYCGCKVIGFVLCWTGHPALWLSNGVAPLSASVAALMVLAGFALPAAGPGSPPGAGCDGSPRSGGPSPPAPRRSRWRPRRGRHGGRSRIWSGGLTARWPRSGTYSAVSAAMWSPTPSTSPVNAPVRSPWTTGSWRLSPRPPHSAVVWRTARWAMSPSTGPTAWWSPAARIRLNSPRSTSTWHWSRTSTTHR